MKESFDNNRDHSSESYSETAMVHGNQEWKFPSRTFKLKQHFVPF